MLETLRLTRELIDQVIFGMENQDSDFLLDTEESTVITADEADPDAPAGRYLDVPPWRSVDGYNLMEQFVGTLHNPIFRERLRAILASGRGVFRQFKDTVRERREIERAWFVFKERHMRTLVSEWFNDLREHEGLSRIESVIDETDTTELIDIDFEFRPATPDDFELIRDFDRAALDELYADLDAAVAQLHIEHLRAGTPDVDDPASVVYVGQTPGEEFAAFLWGVIRENDGARIAFVAQFYVLPEYRGLGLGRGLFYHAANELHRRNVSELILELHGPATELVPSFHAYGMSTRAVGLALDLDRWYRAEYY